MAEDLQELIRQAAEDPAHLPDFEALVRAGRRRRLMARTTMLTAVIAVVALVGAVISATVTPNRLPVIGGQPPSDALGVKVGWSQIPMGPLTPRNAPVGVWTGSELLIVGGSAAPACPPGAGCAFEDEPLADGAAYDPAQGTWRTLADAPVGFVGGDAVLADGRMFVLTTVGGARVMLAYDVDLDKWEELAAPTLPAARLFAAGDRLYAYVQHGSADDSKAVRLPDVWFDSRDGVWEPLPLDPLHATWSRQLLWLDGRTVLIGQTRREDRVVQLAAARLAADEQSWQPLSSIEVPDEPQDWVSAGHVGVSAFVPSSNGSGAAIVFDGSMFALLPDGASWWDEHPGLPVAGVRHVITNRGVLDLQTDLWAPLGRPGPVADEGGVTVWAHDRLLTWGGTNFGNAGEPAGPTGLVATAWQYIPAADPTQQSETMSMPPTNPDGMALPWEERLDWYRVITLDSGLPVLAEAPPDQGIPALHPPATPEPTIDLEAAEDAARERFNDLDGYPERRTFLADYETFGPGSATEADPDTQRRLVWVVLAAPVEMIPGGLAPATPVQMIIMVVVDAHDGSVLAELTM